MAQHDWDIYFIQIAQVVASKSKDPSTKVGCVIVDSEHRPVSFGYNGFVSKCDESYMTYDRPMKYKLIIHAEMNAILFADRNALRGATIYCTHQPCETCLKHILQCGIKRIVYDDPGPFVARGSNEDRDVAERLLNSMPYGSIECIQLLR